MCCTSFLKVIQTWTELDAVGFGFDWAVDPKSEEAGNAVTDVSDAGPADSGLGVELVVVDVLNSGKAAASFRSK